jgi:hypothetical protein
VTLLAYRYALSPRRQERALRSHTGVARVATKAYTIQQEGSTMHVSTQFFLALKGQIFPDGA